MKSFVIEISISASLILTSSCNDISQSDVPNSKQDSIIDNMTKAKNSNENVEGKFLNIQKLTDKTYELSLQLNHDSVAVFETLMPLDQNEIGLLKKAGNKYYKKYRLSC